jgi:pyruvate/2-oxoglutarate dehydrogenase complex dihydrolipoamide dehydrogenase (E3) component
VIGTGPIRQTVIGRARAAGLIAAAVERKLVGSECSQWACIPGKTMLGASFSPTLATLCGDG